MYNWDSLVINVSWPQETILKMASFLFSLKKKGGGNKKKGNIHRLHWTSVTSFPVDPVFFLLDCNKITFETNPVKSLFLSSRFMCYNKSKGGKVSLQPIAENRRENRRRTKPISTMGVVNLVPLHMCSRTSPIVSEMGTSSLPKNHVLGNRMWHRQSYLCIPL